MIYVAGYEEGVVIWEEDSGFVGEGVRLAGEEERESGVGAKEG